ncbi:MAG: restriction endonuclease subunit R [Alkalinema sp. RU_4_3]|nr:restriction endonuclease subunit R [Alkalinema sp. RU_4_3]
MVTTLQASRVDLETLTAEFQLKAVQVDGFFEEWRSDLPLVSEADRTFLDKVRSGFWNAIEHPPLLEKAIQIFVLGPLLLLADFHLPPFHMKVEKSVEITAQDNETIVRGQIDILVLREGFWVLVIESKESSFSIEVGLAQILSYMLAQPDTSRPTFGLIASGGSFVFLKLVRGAVNRYALSRVFEIRNPGNDLYEVLGVLKRLASAVGEDLELNGRLS